MWKLLQMVLHAEIVNQGQYHILRGIAVISNITKYLKDAEVVIPIPTIFPFNLSICPVLKTDES